MTLFNIDVDYQQLQQEINTAVQRALTTALVNLQLLVDPAGPVGEPGPSGPTGEPTGSSSSDRWNPSDLKYFDSYLNKSYEEGEIVTVSKNIYFRSVILFIERLRDVAAVKGFIAVKVNLDIILREIVLL